MTLRLLRCAAVTSAAAAAARVSGHPAGRPVWLLLLLTMLLFLVALLAALVWITHVISSIELVFNVISSIALVFNVMAQSLVECIGSILVGTIFWATRQTLLDTR